MATHASALVGAILALALARPADASGYVARLLGKTCLECHQDSYGRRGLNARGERFHEEGYRYAFDPELTVTHERAPLTPGGAQMLVRRYRDQGRILFETQGLGSARIACSSCHLGGQGLEGVARRYPALDPTTDRWLTLEGAISRCMVERLQARPLVPGSPSAIGLQLWLRDGLAEPAAGIPVDAPAPPPPSGD